MRHGGRYGAPKLFFSQKFEQKCNFVAWYLFNFTCRPNSKKLRRKNIDFSQFYREALFFSKMAAMSLRDDPKRFWAPVKYR